MSLLYTIQALDRARYEPIVVAIRPSREVVALYQDAGIPTIKWPGIGTIEHTTAHWCGLHNPICWLHQADLARNLGAWVRTSTELVRTLKPDLVHLNSVVLSPTAYSLHSLKQPFIWHVREHPVKGYMGLRRHALRCALMQWPNEVIFISQADSSAWIDGARGIVVPNFVDQKTFAPPADRDGARTALGLEEDVPTVLYLGGLSEIKGVFVLLEALAILSESLPDVKCLMPAGTYHDAVSWTSRLARTVLPMIGSGTLGQKIEETIRILRLENICLRFDFQTDIRRFYGASDVVVFPATEPHFARPIVEAGAMERPVVASRLGGAEELVQNGETGILVPPSNAHALASAIRALLVDREKRLRMGKAGKRLFLSKYSATSGIKKIEAAYDHVLGEAQ
jgi:glycosyltransferase involved in cell wall biosynthesis